jgi:hypothetical protein
MVIAGITPPGPWTRLDKVFVASAGFGAAIVAFIGYFTDPRRPTAPSLHSGWWQFSDQGRYLRSALAWAAGRLDPADHWYLPGYPVMAAPFTHITHSNPFLLPDLGLLAVTIWLTGALAGWLTPGWRFARAAGAGAALLSVLPPRILDVWVTPWSSTPEVALSLACLLATLHLTVRPAAPRRAFLVGLCAAAVAAFRPADAAVLSLVAATAAAAALLQAWPGWRGAARVAAAGVAGAAVAVIPTVAGYVAINGWHMNGYLTLSAEIGFEWRLLPARWVTIMLDPRPLFPDGEGLIVAFPWLAFGLGGMVACLVTPPDRGRRLPHALVAGATACHIALYLCYRDLHPQGLWRFYNYHYFKGALVVLAVYTVLLCRVVAERRWGGMLAAVAGLALLLPWRAELVGQDGPLIPVQSGRVLRLPPLTLRVGDAIMVPARGRFEDIFLNQHNVYVGDNEEKYYSSSADVRAIPRPGGLIITPLRRLRAGPIAVYFNLGVKLTDSAPYLMRQQLVFGVPCWLPWDIAACTVSEPVPLHHPGDVIPFDGNEGAIFGAGWSDPEPAGRWTDGPVASLQLRLTPPEIGVLQVTAHAFRPPDSPPLAVTVTVNGTEVAHWVFADEAEHVLDAPVPSSLVGPDDLLQIKFAIADPRRPSETLPDTPDTRLLGLSVCRITVGRPPPLAEAHAGVLAAPCRQPE